MLQILSLLIGGGLIAANSLVVKYLFDLEKTNCECAMDFRRKYIIGFTLYLIIAQAGVLLYGGNSEAFIRAIFGRNIAAQALFSAGVLAAGITNVVFVFQYIDYLKKANCQCSESDYKTLMQVLAGIQAATYGFTALGVLYVLIMIGSVAKVQKTLIKG